jgi:hypothetical protein
MWRRTRAGRKIVRILWTLAKIVGAMGALVGPVPPPPPPPPSQIEIVQDTAGDVRDEE